MFSVSLCVCIYKGIFCGTIFLVFSCKAGEQRKCLCTTVNNVQFRKNVWVFLKEKPKLTLILFQNACMSRLLLKINELVRWRRVSREVYKYQEWPVLLIFFFANCSSTEIITNTVTLGILVLVLWTPGDVGCCMMAWYLTFIVNFLIFGGWDFAGLDSRWCSNLIQGTLAVLSSCLPTIPPTKGTLSSARAYSLHFASLPALAFADGCSANNHKFNYNLLLNYVSNKYLLLVDGVLNV